MESTENGLFPVDTNDYKSELTRRAKLVVSAAERLARERAEMRALVLAALGAGMTENEVVRLSGMSKPSVRAWQGKK